MHIRILIFSAVCFHLERVSSEETENQVNESNATDTSHLPDSTDERFSSLGELLSSLQSFNLNTNLQTQINQIEDIEITTTIKKKVQYDASVLQNQLLNMVGPGIISQQQFQNHPNNFTQQGSINNTDQIGQYPNQGGLENNPVGLNGKVIDAGENQIEQNIHNQNTQWQSNPSNNFTKEKSHRYPVQYTNNLDQNLQNSNQSGQITNNNKPNRNVIVGTLNSQSALVNNKGNPNNSNQDHNTNKETPVKTGDQHKNVLPTKPGYKPNDNYYKDTIFFIDDD